MIPRDKYKIHKIKYKQRFLPIPVAMPTTATRAYLGLVVEMASMNARASLLALTPPTGMRALPDPPQHTQRRDPALTSPRDDGRSPASGM